MPGLHTLKSAALDLVRKGPGETIWTPDMMGLGNILYLCLWAFSQDPERRRIHVLQTPKATPWLSLFPRLGEILLPRAAVPFRDRRTSALDRQYGRYGVDFSQEQLETFIDEFLVPGNPSGDDCVVVNVRRGDYYSVPEHRRQFGMNLNAYLDAALTGSRNQHPIGRVLVISDDVRWCRAELGTLLGAFSPQVSFADESDTAAHNYLDVAGARRLVLTNSTFSYWGGYVASKATDPSLIWAPRFFDRAADGIEQAAHHLDPRWSIVELPDGWSERA